MSKVRPIHPGEILLEEFMRPYKLNPHRLAMALRVSAPTIYQIVARKRPISSEMALRLARFFKTTPEFWANLQASFELRVARSKAEQRVKREVVPLEAIA